MPQRTSARMLTVIIAAAPVVFGGLLLIRGSWSWWRLAVVTMLFWGLWLGYERGVRWAAARTGRRRSVLLSIGAATSLTALLTGVARVLERFRWQAIMIMFATSLGATILFLPLPGRPDGQRRAA